MTNHLKNTQESGLHEITARVSKLLSELRPSYLKTRSWRTKAGVLLAVASIVSGFMTYAALRESPPFGDDPDIVVWLLNIDLVILLLLVSLIARRIVDVWSGRKRGIAGSHLHVRLVYLFSVLVAVPTIIMTVFSAFFFHFGVQAWFSQRVQTAINESNAVAQSYLEEHKQVIRADTRAMANDLERQTERMVMDEHDLSQMLDTQVFFRNLSEAVIVTSKGRVLARSSMSFTLEYETPSDYARTQADQGDVVLIMGKDGDRVRALAKLDNLRDAYLFVGRMVDPRVLSHLNATRAAVEDYNSLQAQSSGMQITVTLLFVLVGFLLLLAAIWAGLLLAKQLVSPIGELITASDRVRGGDLSSRVPENMGIEEFEYLARSFNRMTSQIQSQRNDLIDANRQLDRRRHFTETVLSGVSSGVLGVDYKGHINVANNSAENLLAKSSEEIVGQYILDIIPELADMLGDVAKRPKKMMQREVLIQTQKTGKRMFLFRLSIEALGDNHTGLIITFDDITELQSAQRKAAWSDVARRIAHEIKNPLTPIQLSAERLKRKYLDEIESDKNTFAQCTDTIIKHVSDIGRMVDEFSSFARMPEPVLQSENIISQIEESLFLSKQAHTDIRFTLRNTADGDLYVDVDVRQIRQVMTNLLQNAVDSIKGYTDQGHIDIMIGLRGLDEVFIALSDNGAGFPEGEDVSKLTDPYITHKPKGTGLGLAIVKKIMDDHNGSLALGVPDWLSSMNEFEELGGACVVLSLPKTNAIKKNNTEGVNRNYA